MPRNSIDVSGTGYSPKATQAPRAAKISVKHKRRAVGSREAWN